MADDATTPTETQGPTFYSIEQLSDSTEVLSAAATLYAQRSVFPAVGPGRAQTPLPTGKGISDGAAILEKINSGDLEQLTPEQKVQLTGWAIDVAEFSASNALGSYLSDVVNRDTASPDIKNSFRLIQNAYSISEVGLQNLSFSHEELADNPVLLKAVATLYNERAVFEDNWSENILYSIKDIPFFDHNKGLHEKVMNGDVSDLNQEQRLELVDWAMITGNYTSNNLTGGRLINNTVDSDEVNPAGKAAMEAIKEAYAFSENTTGNNARAVLNTIADPTSLIGAGVGSLIGKGALKLGLQSAATGTLQKVAVTTGILTASESVTFVAEAAASTVINKATAQTGQKEGNQTMVKMTAEETALFDKLKASVLVTPAPPPAFIGKIYDTLPPADQTLLESSYTAIDGLKASGQIHPLRQGELSEFQAALYGFETQTAANGQALRIDGNGLVSEAAVTVAPVTTTPSKTPVTTSPAASGTTTPTTTTVTTTPAVPLTPEQELQALLVAADKRFGEVNKIIDASIIDAGKVIDTASDAIKGQAQAALDELTAGQAEWGELWDAKKDAIKAITDPAKIDLLIAELKAQNTVPYTFTIDTNVITTASAEIERLHETVFPGILTRADQVNQHVVDRGFLGEGTSTSVVSDTINNGGLFLTGAFKEVGGQAIDLFKDMNKNDGALGEWGPVAMQLAGALGIGLLLKNTLLDRTLGKVWGVGPLLSAGAAIFVALKYGTGITASVQEYFTGERTSIQQQGGAATLARLNNMASTTVDDTKETKIVVEPAKPLTETEIVAAAQKALEQNANTEIVAQTGYGSGHVDYRLLQAVAAQKSGAGHTANGLNDNDPEAEIQAYTVHHGFQITGTDSIKVAIGGNTPTPVPDNNNIPTPEEAELQRMVP